MAAPGQAIPGTVVNSGAKTSPGGPQGTTGGVGPVGPPGSPGLSGTSGTSAWTTVAVSSFTVPAYGSTVIVNMLDTSWIAVGEWVYIDDASGAGLAGQLVVQSKTSTTVTLLNPLPSTFGLPRADATQDGLMRRVSGNTTDFVDGSNNCQSITILIPPGTVWETACVNAPSGWLLCDGSIISRTTYAVLFAAIGTTFGAGDGSTTFQIPDCRGRGTIGAGQGASLTNRVLGANGGEETHQLSIAELATHTHVQNAHNHLQDQHFHTINSYVTGNVTGAGQTTFGGPGTTSNSNYTVATNQATTATNQNTGSGTAHNTMQPFIALNKMIKT